jgi:RNA polymerase sigma-70 factor (ECF subfamily)
MTRDETLPMEQLLAVEAEESCGPMTESEFRAFYDSTAPRLRAYLRRIAGSEHLADDLLQDSYIRFLGSSFAGDAEAQAKAYLYRIATNLVRDHARKHRREVLQDTPPDQGTSPHPEARLDMQRLFARLRPRERALLWLAHVQGLSHREIADQTGVAERSVRVALFRARRSLAGLLAKRGLKGAAG